MSNDIKCIYQWVLTSTKHKDKDTYLSVSAYIHESYEQGCMIYSSMTAYIHETYRQGYIIYLAMAVYIHETYRQGYIIFMVGNRSDVVLRYTTPAC